jgi:uncharacterized damage-inducible protein DinB
MNADALLFSVQRTLARTPAEIATIVRTLTDAELVASPAENVWSVQEVLGHLWDLEPVFCARVHALRANLPARAYDAPGRAAELDFNRIDSQRLLAGFDERRRESLLLLGTIRADELTTEGVHETMGVVTMANILACWAASDLRHTAQIHRLLLQPLIPFLGPWEESYRGLRY